MNASAISIAAQYKMNTQLFTGALEGISEHYAGVRLNEQTNHILFIAGHIISSRYGSANLLGLGAGSPFNGICNRGAELREPSAYPSLSEMKKEWQTITDKLFNKLEEADDNILFDQPPVAFPTVDNTVRGALVFLAQHEMYHLGQLVFLRKSFGLKSPIDG